MVGWFMVFNATFNSISVILWRSVLLVEETRVPGGKPLTCHKSHWRTNLIMTNSLWINTCIYLIESYYEVFTTLKFSLKSICPFKSYILENEAINIGQLLDLKKKKLIYEWIEIQTILRNTGVLLVLVYQYVLPG